VEKDIAGRQESNRFAWPSLSLSSNQYRPAFWRLAIPHERSTRAYVCVVVQKMRHISFSPVANYRRALGSCVSITLPAVAIGSGTPVGHWSVAGSFVWGQLSVRGGGLIHGSAGFR